MFVVMTVAILIKPALGAKISEHISTEALLEYLDSIERDQESLRQEFMVTWYYGQSADAAPPEQFEKEHLVYTQRIVLVCSKERYKAEITYLKTHDSLVAMNGQFHVLTWDGQEARLTTLGSYSGDLTQQSSRIDNQLMREFIDLPILNWSGVWVFGGSYFIGYGDLLRNAVMSAPRVT